MTPLPKLDLDALVLLESAATPAPWHPDWHYVEGGGSCAKGPTCDDEDENGEEAAEADAKLIAAARNALPALIAAARRLEALEADLRKSVAAWRSSAVCLKREAQHGIAIRQTTESKLSRVEVLTSNADELERKLDLELGWDPNTKAGK